MFMKNLLIGIVLAVCLAQLCEGIKCYRCTSHKDAFCGEDNFSKGKNPEVVDCGQTPAPTNIVNPKAPTKCSKVVLKDNAGMVVRRDCHWERMGDSSQSCYYDHNMKLDKCETCSDDLCNSAPKQIANSFGIMIAVMAIFKNFLFY